jgi:cytochrome c oxidase assembly protein subunit 15
MKQGAPFSLPKPPGPAYTRGPHWFAFAAACFTLPLLYVGGSVTTYRVGLAVPDWPTTFGINMFLYDFWNAPFGVRIEHAHRLYGAAVGLCTVLLAAFLLTFETRRWTKGLGLLAVVAVVIQGLLGGTRVTQTSTLLAAVHGCLGQAFFALMVVLCVVTGRGWQETSSPQFDEGRLRRRILVVLGLLALQILLGSWLRHYGTWPALAAHAGCALAVWVYAMSAAIWVERRRAHLVPVVPSVRTLGITATLQVVLGVVSFIYLLPFDGTPRPVTFYQAVVRTAHQTTGALVLAAAVVASLRVFQHLSPSKSSRASRGEEGAAAPIDPVALDWGAVA